MALTPGEVARWRWDWDAMMRHYQPGRDDLLAAGFAAVEEVHGRFPERVLDIGGGPGTTAEAMLRRWQLLRPGGLLLVGDAMRQTPPVAAEQQSDSGNDPWTAWWTTLADAPAMASVLRERAAVLAGRASAEFVAPVDWHRETARRAGFGDARVLHQRADHTLMAFWRPPDRR